MTPFHSQNSPSPKQFELANSCKDLEKHSDQEVDAEVCHDYSMRAQWLRAAVLGANDGLLSTASLMMGVGAVREDIKIMILTGIAGMIAGACSMAIGEFVSVYAQYDIEMAQLKREKQDGKIGKEDYQIKKDKLPNPLKAALASAFAFIIGALVPMLSASFIKAYKMRMVVVVGSVSVALLGFGMLSAVLGKAPMVKSSLRVLLGGWLAMAITFGATKSFHAAGFT